MGVSNSVLKGLNFLKKNAKKAIDGLEDVAKDASKTYKETNSVTEAAKKTVHDVKSKAGGAYNNMKEEFHDTEFYQNNKDCLGIKTVRGAKRIIKGTLKHTIKVEDDPEAFFGKKFKPKASLIAIGFASTLVDPAKTVAREVQRSKYGDIDGGYAPGTINATSSPTFESSLAYAQSEKGLKEISNNMGGNISRDIAGVDAEVVFALHNLRNSGGSM